MNEESVPITGTWDTLLNHPQHQLTIDGASITVEDGVFTPDPTISYSTSIIVDNFPDVAGKRVADVGTGTGVLAILAALKGAQEVVATDSSDAAVENARRNASGNGVTETVTVVKTNLLDGIDGTFDVIFANLPILDDNVWNKVGVDVSSTVKDFFATVGTKLNTDGAIYLPWGSFAEKERAGLAELVTDAGFTFRVISAEKIGHRWYLYLMR